MKIGASPMEIRPFDGIGQLNFEMSRNRVHAVLNAPLQRFRKYDDEPEIDVSNELGIHLYYDRSDCLEFVEAFEPASVVFHGVTFLGRDIQGVVADMETYGFIPTESDGYSVVFKDIGIALTCPSGIVEGIAAFKKGYYDK